MSGDGLDRDCSDLTLEYDMDGDGCLLVGSYEGYVAYLIHYGYSATVLSAEDCDDADDTVCEC